MNVGDAYDRHSFGYDMAYMSPADRAENVIVSEHIRMIEDRPRGAVVDLGCGTGLTLEMSGVHPLDYIGVDVSRGMLAVARRKFPGYAFTEADMLDVLSRAAYTGVRFSAAVSLFGSINHLLPEQQTLLFQTLGYVLRPGAPVFVVVAGKRQSFTGVDLPVYRVDTPTLRDLAAEARLCDVRVTGLSYALHRSESFEGAETRARIECRTLGRLWPSGGQFIILEGRRRG